MTTPSYDDYVRDDAFIAGYLAYQERWSKDVRESDKVLMRPAAETVDDAPARGIDPIVLDSGCSPGPSRSMPAMPTPGWRASR